MEHKQQKESSATEENLDITNRHWTDRLKIPATALLLLGATTGGLRGGEDDSGALREALNPPAVTTPVAGEVDWHTSLPDLQHFEFTELQQSAGPADQTLERQTTAQTPQQEHESPSTLPPTEPETEADETAATSETETEEAPLDTIDTEPAPPQAVEQVPVSNPDTEQPEESAGPPPVTVPSENDPGDSSGETVTVSPPPVEKDFWDHMTKVGLAITTVGLGVLSVMAAMRGVIKGSIEVQLWRKSLKRFDNREFTDTASCNPHSFIERDGKLVLEADTMARPMLDEFMGNRGARLHFLKAARKCTYNQPLIYLEFPRDADDGRFMRNLSRAIFKPLHYLTFKSCFKWAAQPPDPHLERFSALNRTNKILREAVSSIYNQNNLGLTAKQFSKEIPYEFIEKNIIVIPICDVSKPDEKQRRTLILATLPIEDFHKLGDPEEYARMTVSSGIPIEKLRTLKAAYDESLLYGEFKDQWGNPQQLFPIVRIYLPRPMKPFKRTVKKNPEAEKNDPGESDVNQA